MNTAADSEPELKLVTSGSVFCWADTVRLAPHSDTIVMLSMVGDRNSVRSIWAKLVGANAKSDFWNKSVRVDDIGLIRIDIKDRPITSASEFNGGHHIVMMDPRMTNFGTVTDRFIHVGNINRFVARMSQNISTPIVPSWGEYLWTQGVSGKLITPASGFGIEAFTVIVNDERWLEIIKDGLVRGSIS